MGSAGAKGRAEEALRDPPQVTTLASLPSQRQLACRGRSGLIVHCKLVMSQYLRLLDPGGPAGRGFVTGGRQARPSR